MGHRSAHEPARLRLDGAPPLREGDVVPEPPPQPLRNEFHTELERIRTEIARLAAGVTEDILRATDILLAQDLSGAEEMIVADDAMDVACLALEQRCYRVLA